MIRTCKQLEETCVVDKQGNKVAYQVTTVKAFIERCIEKGLVK